MPKEGFMSVAEAAEAMGVNPRTVLHRIAAGTIKAERLDARTWVIPAEEIERFRGQGRLKSGPKPGTKRRRRQDQDTSSEG